MAENIVSPDINEAFLEAVISLSDKLKYLQQEAPAKDGSSLDIPPAETFAGRSLLPDLEKLKIRAIAKARDYFLAQFQALRKPKTNVQVVQQISLCKYALLLQFVQREAPAAGEDLRSEFHCMYYVLFMHQIVIYTTTNCILIAEFLSVN